MSEKRIQINSVVKNQVPQYVREDYPLVTEFLKQYYISQEFQGAPLDLIQNIDKYVKIDETTVLKAEMVRRRPEEEPYIQLRALSGTPLKTGSVDLILYRHDVLAESDEQTSNADWELISFHAIPEGIHDMPMGPVTMMRNQLQLTGGTKAYYKSEDWAESVNFWQRYAMLKTTTSNSDT